MQLFLQLSKLQGTTSYFDGNMGRVGVKSDTVHTHLAQTETVPIMSCLQVVSSTSFQVQMSKYEFMYIVSHAIL